MQTAPLKDTHIGVYLTWPHGVCDLVTAAHEDSVWIRAKRSLRHAGDEE